MTDLSLRYDVNALALRNRGQFHPALFNPLYEGDGDSEQWSGHSSSRAEGLLELNSGAVSSLEGRLAGITATQSTGSKQLDYDQTNGLMKAAAADKNLIIPHLDNAHLFRWVFFIGRFKTTGAATDVGTLAHINGITGATTARKPALLYWRDLDEVGSVWRDSSEHFEAQVDHPSDDDIFWLVSRIRSSDGKNLVSINGGDEVVSSDSNYSPPSGGSLTGLIGDFAGAWTGAVAELGLGSLELVDDKLDFLNTVAALRVSEIKET